MSNIFTDAIRVHARPGDRIDAVEAQWITWILLGRRGSYHVPVLIRREPDGAYVDIQYGSGKSPDIVNFCEDHAPYLYGAIWGRHYNEGSDRDVIWQDDVNDGPYRYCRYGFDEVRVTTTDDRPPVAPEAPWRRHPDGSWRLSVNGSYLTGNCRQADVGPMATPTTPLPDPPPTALPTPTTPNDWGDPLRSIDPRWLAPLADEHPTATLVEYRWRGRIVHRAREDDDWDGPSWQHRCADDWDNCLDPEFLRATGATDLLAPDEVYARDRAEWEKRAAR
ncbi:hypothetical protein SBI_07439 [Streptomyces bingchenggensis BCW-1]|uniref:Uncharacterized protein n=2 Tax=Streptomyces TaxID=1883 RepID=D7C941_STRBB|nr:MULTISPECIES: hypothetical protein [Streptomyces]ADI10559.1 hypothetical protein SBI_07439 [Streptomyces bingchenggensis BCW-1]